MRGFHRREDIWLWAETGLSTHNPGSDEKSRERRGIGRERKGNEVATWHLLPNLDLRSQMSDVTRLTIVPTILK